jgi:hypothetical protein
MQQLFCGRGDGSHRSFVRLGRRLGTLAISGHADGWRQHSSPGELRSLDSRGRLSLREHFYV